MERPGKTKAGRIDIKENGKGNMTHPYHPHPATGGTLKSHQPPPCLYPGMSGVLSYMNRHLLKPLQPS